MRIVIALGGQALLWRSAPMTAEVQGRNARIAARAIAPLAAEHSIVVVHGNGPHVSPLAHQAEQRRLGHVTPGELAGYQFASGSMGPKVEAAVRFATKTGNRAAIGALADIPGIVAGRAGTNVIMRSGLRTAVPAASGGGVTAVAAGTEAGEATPRRTWNPARRGPGPMAGAG